MKVLKVAVVVCIACIACIACWALIVIAIRMRFERRLYPLRCKECAPNELFEDLERRYNIHFPAGLEEIRAAKSVRYDLATRFCLKFRTDETTLIEFLNNLPGELRTRPYDAEYDYRTTATSKYDPDWMKNKIVTGKKVGLTSVYGLVEVIIDTSEKDFVTVYIYGHY